jgi:ABC-type multidrug transport system ATPase subunit
LRIHGIILAEVAKRWSFLSTHISSDLERVATHVAVLVDGQIACSAELDELKDRVKRLRLWTDVAPRHTRQDPVRGKVTEKTPLPDESFYRVLDEFPHLRTVTNWANGTERLVPDRIAHLPESCSPSAWWSSWRHG